MTFAERFVWVVHALAGVSVLGVALTGEITAAYVGIAGLALAWSLVAELRGWSPPVAPRAANAATVLGLALTVGPALLGRTSPVDAIASFLLVLTALKALAPKAGRDWLQIVILSFFQLVGASALTIEPAFALVFLAYLVLAPLAFVLLHLHRELEASEHAHHLRDRDLVDTTLLRSVASVTAVVFVLTIALFVIFPRAGAGYLGGLFGQGTGISGFSDQVELGDVSALKIDEAVALRVTIEGVGNLPLAERYWRGAVLDEFDGRRWSRGSSRPIQLRRQGSTIFVLPWNRTGVGRTLRLDVVLEPILTPTVFALGRVHSVQGPFAGIVGDVLGNLHGSWDRRRRIRYQMVTSLAPPSERPTAASYDVGSIPERVRRLATTIVGGATDPFERAGRLADHFERGFVYSLEPGDPGDADPVERFLFDTRAGHCEYFASSLALLHRAAGMPSRLVTGYHGGEWNEFGGYLVVRNSHAHTWVETWVAGAWRRFDPTPPSAAATSGLLARLSALGDASRMRWYRYVVNYDVEDQFALAFSIRDRGLDFREGLRALAEAALGGHRPSAALEPRYVFGSLGLAAAAFAIALHRRRRTRNRGTAVRPETASYHRMLAAVARRGLDKRAGETADEFARRVAAAEAPEGPLVGEISELYEQLRFGTAPGDEAARRARLEVLVGELVDGARH